MTRCSLNADWDEEDSDEDTGESDEDEDKEVYAAKGSVAYGWHGAVNILCKKGRITRARKMCALRESQPR
jgi:hypothetical protein